MINSIMGIEYGRGACAVAKPGGPACAPGLVKEMFPDADWTTVVADPFDAAELATDRFGENLKIQKKIFAATPYDRHILIGGDHSVNFGHFAALADRMPDTDICLIYIDAHLDIHNPNTSRAQASGAPHGTNVRALMGDGDTRWLALQSRRPALKPENMFYLGARSYEPAEIEYVRKHNIFMRSADELRNTNDIMRAIAEIRTRIDLRPFVVSFDFDSIDPNVFQDVLVPAANGISVDAAKIILREFRDADSFEFVEYSPSGDAACRDIVRDLIQIAVKG